jgi:hypothetical protein
MRIGPLITTGESRWYEAADDSQESQDAAIAAGPYAIDPGPYIRVSDITEITFDGCIIRMTYMNSPYYQYVRMMVTPEETEAYRIALGER